MSRVFDDTRCALGEGPLWHPGRGQLFWFDILRHRMHTREGGHTRTWEFGEHVSAAGWVDDTRLLIASETRLMLLDVETDASEDIAPLEADDPATRSNDGRADPWGGFWIGTMGKRAEKGAGAIYRFFDGEVVKLYDGVTISNSIAFSPDRRVAYFTDTPTQVIRRQPLDPDTGWPAGAPEPWLDLSDTAYRPDGSVCDAEGNLWNAQWGAWRVACYAPDGSFLRAVEFDAAQASCPAFGGAGLTTLFCTSAANGAGDDARARSSSNGMTFAEEDVAAGQAEHRVRLA